MFMKRTRADHDVCVTTQSVSAKKIMMTTLMKVRNNLINSNSVEDNVGRRVSFNSHRKSLDYFWSSYHPYSSDISERINSPTLGGSDVEPDPSKRALGPVTELVRLGNYKIDYSRVNPQLHKLLVSKKKQNTNSFFNLLRYLSSVISCT